MKWIKGYVAGLLTALLVCGLVVTAGAKSGKVMQELTYRDIRVSLDGEVLDLRNAIGEKVEPFMFDGTNYLPVRALAEALGLNVAWNGAEVMVVLTTPEPPAVEPEAEFVSVASGDAITPAAENPTPVAEPEPQPVKAAPEAVKEPEPVREPEPPAPTADSRIVYVTKTGKHYHYSDTCNGGTYYASTLSEALARKLTPCDKCVLTGN